ncbi:hypothetical protein [Lacticaseibacillus absianus]|uniref:hypothetical protein n=1 Tax=Lacticaseibacillus absianus TaxID=2729623 RepID=UPI0015C6BEB3|nr:hypothetical protein [Lacticaseibacillus absianus]
MATRLIWRRHRWLWLVAALLMLLYTGNVVRSGASQYNDLRTSMMTPQAFARDRAKPDKDRQTGEQTYRAYKDHWLMFYQNYGEEAVDHALLPTGVANGPLTIDLFYLLGLFLLGLVVSAWDHFGRFDRFLMATRFTRRRIFWTRTGGYLGLVIGGTIAVNGLAALGLHLLIPAHYLNLSGSMVLGLTLYNTALAALGFTTGLLFGMLCGRVWLLAALAVATVVVADQTVQGLSTVWGQLTQGTASLSWASLAQPLWAYWPLMIGYVIMTIALLILGAWSYTQLSLEQDGQALILPRLRPLVVAIGMVVAFGTFLGTDQHGRFVLGNSIQAPLIVLALGVLWAFWPQLAVRLRAWRVQHH